MYSTPYCVIYLLFFGLQPTSHPSALLPDVHALPHHRVTHNATGGAAIQFAEHAQYSALFRFPQIVLALGGLPCLLVTQEDIMKTCLDVSYVYLC